MNLGTCNAYFNPIPSLVVMATRTFLIVFAGFTSEMTLCLNLQRQTKAATSPCGQQVTRVAKSEGILVRFALPPRYVETCFAIAFIKCPPRPRSIQGRSCQSHCSQTSLPPKSISTSSPQIKFCTAIQPLKVALEASLFCIFFNPFR